MPNEHRPRPHRAVALALAVMALGLGGCSTHPPEKKQGQILAEALAKTPNPTQARELVTVTIPSHGALADQLAIASGGGANATQLAALLSQVARSSTPRVLVIGGAPALDAAVMQGALKGQRLEGLQVIFAGLPEQEADIATLVRAAGARFDFVSRQ
ncbi:hypothetical protein [Metapseudomonas otitidis]|uniref:hypothetical protein n=2 Tax=Metapseudomonas otitidis TaxID=319939 RepID=UPI0026032287|nr:hypothetical protein [Pseudomonas otitidis]